MELKERLEEFLHSKGILKELRRVTAAGQKSLVVPFEKLIEFDMELAKVLLERPAEIFEAADAILEGITKLPGVRLRVRGLDKSVEIRNIRADHVGKFVQVESMLMRSGEVKPEAKEAVFKCRRCGEENRVLQVGEFFREPLACENPTCLRKGPFDLVIESTVFRDWQSLSVQEPPEKLRGGRMPRRLDGIVRDDFVDKAVPGNRVVMTGVLRVFQEGQRRERKTTFRKILFVNHIEVLQKGAEEAELSPEDEERIKELAKDPWVKNLIVQSIAPGIYGYDAIKEAIALQLFGCDPVELPDGTRLRGDTHILLSGDPAVAKSQLLKWVSNSAPRGLYTSGMKATGAGLTAAAVRDEIGGGWALEAGALVIADGGLASIDEFEKMNPEDANAILESMEQQSYHPSMEILLANGKKIRIGEFVDGMFERYPDAVVNGVNCEILPLATDVEVFTLDSTEVKMARINRVSRHVAPEKFISLTYSNGRSIVITSEHPVFVWRDGNLITVPAEKVIQGDFVPAPRMMPNSTEAVYLSSVEKCYPTEKDISLPEALNPGLAGIAGFLVTEGCFYEPYEVSFSNRGRHLLREMRQLMEREFEVVPSVRVNADTDVISQRYNSVRLYKWFEKNFPEIVARAASKRAPAKIMSASREIVREFLRAAFLGDGSLESTSICYRTKSRGLAEDYQDLLLKLSINSRLLTDKSNDSFKVYIAGDSLEKFLSEIVSDDDLRAGKIREMVEKSRRTCRHHDCLPTDVARKIKSLLKTAGLAYNGYFEEHFESKYGITREVLLNYVDKLRKRFESMPNAEQTASTLLELRLACGYSQVHAARLLGVKRSTIDYAERGGYTKARRRELLASFKSALSREAAVAISRLEEIEELARLRWLRVKKVEVLPNEGQVKTEWVYDITVEPTHSFISHGLVLHNTISVAKAGIVATLNTRTAVLAAANPKLGRFERNLTIAQQIALDPVILSRFDLIFIMLDVPRAERDRTIARHILDMHAAPKKVVKPPLDMDFLRRVIIYARKNVHPKFEDKEAMKVIEDFFVEWRRVAERGEAPLPITVRQLEALVRLAKANARLRLSDRVTVEDANCAIRLVKLSLQEAGMDLETGKIDIDIWMTGKTKSQRERLQRVLEIIKELEGDYGGAAPIDEIKRVAESEGISRSFVDEMIDHEKMRGHLYEPKPGMVSRAVK